MKEKDFKRFITALKILSVIALIVLVAMSISTLVSVGLFILLLFIKESTVVQFLSSTNVSMFIENNNQIQVQQLSTLSDIVYDKPSVLLYIGVTIIYSLLFSVASYYAYKLFKNMSQREIFSVQNSRLIKTIGYLFISLTVIYAVKESASTFVYFRMFKTALESTGLTVNLQMTLLNVPLLVASIIILLIGYAFKYGLFLKEEYDQTI